MKDLWVPLSGAIAQQRKVETIANNVANINTPGFKRDSLVFKEYLTAMEKGVEDIDLPTQEWKPADFYRSYGAEHAHVKVDGSYSQFTQGNLTLTKNPLDVALNGPGFFEILGPNGVRYTRKGIFTLSHDGKLVTDQGYPVLARKQEGVEQTPAERTITIPPGYITVTEDGAIFSNNQKLATLSMVEFLNAHQLRKEGNSLFINNDLQNINQNKMTTTAKQGYVEESNVNAINEMARLINANRQFESIQRVIKAYDNMAAKGVNEIARF